MTVQTLIELVSPILVTKLGLDKKNINTEGVKTKITNIYDTLVSKVGAEKVAKICSCFKADGVAESIIDACKTGFTEIMKDGKIDSNDSPIFIRMVRNVSSNIGKITKDSITVTIEGTDLVELCGFFLRSFVAVLIENFDDQKLAFSLIDSAMELINFKMDGKQIKCGCFPCC
jgi:hypothetical protein